MNNKRERVDFDLLGYNDFLNRMEGFKSRKIKDVSVELSDDGMRKLQAIKEYLRPSRALENVVNEFKKHGLLTSEDDETLQLLSNAIQDNLSEASVMEGSDPDLITLDLHSPGGVYKDILTRLVKVRAASQAATEDLPLPHLPILQLYLRYSHNLNADSSWFYFPGFNNEKKFRVGINEGLWYFISAFSKLFALWCWAGESENKQVEREKTLNSSVDRFDLLKYLFQLYEECPTAIYEIASLRLYEPEQDIVSQRFSAHAKQFLIAHEFSHCWLRHPVGALTQRTRSRDKAWNEEKEADRTAVTLLITAAFGSQDANDISWAFWGADQFLGMFRVIEAYYGIKEPTDSHPPTEDRQKAIRDFISTRCGLPKALTDRMIANSKAVNQLFDYLAAGVANRGH